MKTNAPAQSPSSRKGLQLPTIFAFWLCVSLCFYTVGGVEITQDGRRVPVLSWAWLKHALEFATPFSIGTAILWRAAPRFTGRPPLIFWRACAALVGSLSLLHACADGVVSRPGLEWRYVPAVALTYVFYYGGILGFVLTLHQRREAEARRRELLAAQLRALRAQLQPHFLFNTLQAIGTTARHDGSTASRMTALLGDLLRNTLRERTGDLVTLAEEQEQLQPYIQLQQLRFGERLRIEVDLPAALLGAKVPDLLLQPLVENALEHGISRRPGGGTILLRARRDTDSLVVEIVDDGEGPGDGYPHGTGLGATTARLDALFGARASLRLTRNERGGTTATLVVPFTEVANAA